MIQTPEKGTSMADLKENQLSGGTPTRLRGLDASGNSIAPTLEEVTNAMPVVTDSTNGLLSSDRYRIVNQTYLALSNPSDCIKLYESKEQSHVFAFIACCRVEGDVGSVYLLSYSLANNGVFRVGVKYLFGDNTAEFYYLLDGGSASIYIVPHIDYSITRISPLFEFGSFTYHLSKDVLATNAVKINIS